MPKERNTLWKNGNVSLGIPLTRQKKLAAAFDVDLEEMRRIHKEFPIRINPYYLSLIEEPGDPIWKQVVPDPKELMSTGVEDPLHEEDDSEVPNVTHRYPDRALFYVNYMCPIYCRFCHPASGKSGTRIPSPRITLKEGSPIFRHTQKYGM